MNTDTLDHAFAALTTSMMSILDDTTVSKKGNAIAVSIDQFSAYVVGDGFATIVKEARGEPVLKIIPVTIPERSVSKADAAASEAAKYDREAAEEVAKILGKPVHRVTKAAPTLTAEQSFAKKLADDPAEYDRYEKQRYSAVAKLQLE